MAGERVERRLTAILAADVAGYSRLMGADEEGTLAALKAIRREVVDPNIAEHRGRIVKTTGDGLLVEFASVVDAMRCAVEVQAAMAERNADMRADKRIEFRIGINLGDIIIDDGDIFGDGVNIAARLEALAEPGGICVNRVVRDQVRDRLDIAFADMGEQQVKNIARPVRVFRVALIPPTPAARAPSLSRNAGRNGAGEGNAPPLALPDKPSIAVMPFANMSGDPEQEYFADGMVEEIVTALSRIRWLTVIARNSSFTYKGQAIDVKQVGRELGVRYVLEGSVRKGGSRVRITAQLIEAASGTHLWAERYDRDLTDIFALQDEITERVAAVIEPQLHAAEYVRSERKPPESLDAWECVVRAIAGIAQGTRAGTDEAEALCRRALEIAPGYGQAHSLLAWALMRRAYLSGQLKSTLAEASAEARAALVIDERDSWAHLGQGIVLFWRKNYGEAEAAYHRALEFNPNSALAHAALGQALAAQGKHEAAVASAERALRLSPGDPLVGGQASHTVVFARFAARQYADSIAAARAMIERYPEYLPAHFVLIAALATANDMVAATEAVTAVIKLKPDFSMAWLRENMPWGGEIGARLLEGWQRAGVPEV
jgi:TolB-like protein/class 3 adenylate cyclase/tetratricopeptide (TPR) repeat protein